MDILGVVPYLCSKDAKAASDFYKKAFGAEEVGQAHADDKGRYMHIHLRINGGSLMLSDGFPEHGHPWKQPQGFTLTLSVKDIDAWWKRAVDAGCTVVTPLQKMFWGDRYGQLRDPFGTEWAMNEPDGK